MSCNNTSSSTGACELVGEFQSLVPWMEPERRIHNLPPTDLSEGRRGKAKTMVRTCWPELGQGAAASTRQAVSLRLVAKRRSEMNYSFSLIDSRPGSYRS